MERTKTRNALELIARDTSKVRNYKRLLEEERFNAQVARIIYEARTSAGLTQRQLAGLVKTTQPVIARLEDADYEGHSLKMLRRIAEALDRQVELRLLPRRRGPQRAG